MPRSASLSSLLSLPSLKLISIAADGDCFYKAIATALGDPHTVSSLRALVSSKLSDDQFSMFQLAYDAQVAGYEFMRRVRSLEALKSLFLVEGTDGGGGHCVWAEGFGVQTVVDEVGVILCVVDEEARAREDRFVVMRPEGGEEVGKGGVIVLQRTRRSHYNLITDGGEAIVKDSVVLAKFGVDVDVDEQEPPAKRRK